MSDPASAYETYRQAPTPENLASVVSTLQPTINHALHSLQSHSDPVMQTHAKVLTAQAVRKFNPESGAQLHTWVSHQLLPLRRLRRQSQAVVKLPERVQLDAFTLHRAEQEFMDQHGREPDVAELADHSKIPVRRIKIIRNTLRRTPSEADIGDSAPPEETDFAPEALEYVHGDADHIDRRIIEHKTGFGGAEVIPPFMIAQKLGLTPTQLTRRSQRLALRVQRIEAQLKGLQG